MDALFDQDWWVWVGWGLAVTLLLGIYGTGRTIKRIKKEVTDLVKEYTTGLDDKTQDEKDAILSKWRRVSKFPPFGGTMIGLIEKVVFFFGLLLGKEIVIGAWVTFKVAAKWETWSNIVKVSSKEEESGFDQVMRRYWGTLIMQRFVVGTGLNFIWAAVGVLVTLLLGKFT